MNCLLCSGYSGTHPAHTFGDRHYWRCGACGLLWRHPGERMAFAAEKARYDTHENNGIQYLNYLSKLALPTVALVPNKAARGLDFGCGPTEGMKELLYPLGFSVDSYDPIFFPRELPKNHYDFLLCSEAAEHFYDPLRELALIDSCLKAGAIIGVSSLLTDGVDFESWWYRRDPSHVVFYAARTVDWIAARLGWELLRLDSPLWLLRKK